MTTATGEVPELPAFAREIDSTLAVHSQYVLYGNIRDVFVQRQSRDVARLVPLRRLLWQVFRRRGYRFLLIVDQVDGLTVYPSGDDDEGRAARAAANEMLGEDVSRMAAPSLDRLRKYLARFDLDWAAVQDGPSVP